MPTISPFLWFNEGAEEAANLYVSIFNGTIIHQQRWGSGAAAPEGSLMSVEFEIDGRRFQAFNGGPGHPFSDSFSLAVTVETQEEIDSIWDRLIGETGKGVACGWLLDQFGLSWQIVPTILPSLLSDPDSGRATRATQAMLGMVKLDIAALKAAADG